jgi:hypothetical protein
VQTKRQKESELASDLQRSLMRAGGWAGGISSRGSGEREKKGAARKADPTREGERRPIFLLRIFFFFFFLPVFLCAFSFVTSKLPGGGDKKDTPKKSPLTQKKKKPKTKKKPKKIIY